MIAKEKVNILLVDDQPSKLLTLETILADLNENIFRAGSADEALKYLLECEMAMVLVDVCMPKMDGFELAELIRSHPRCNRTAIIFISAVHLTDADRLKGYVLGAVDYIPVPIVPELLRAKVSVFAELFRKTEQLARLNRELERRVAERTADLEASNSAIKESEQQYRQLVHGLPAAVYTCDAQGHITLFNEAAATLWGCRPQPGENQWCGSSRLFRADGSPLSPADCAAAIALREGRSVRGDEVIIERPDGARRHVQPFSEPIFDVAGRIIGAVNVLSDVTQAKEAQRAQALLAAIVASSDDAIVSKKLDGTITSWNRGAERMFGYPAAEMVGRSILKIIPPERHDEEATILARLSRAEHIEHYETVRVTKDGRRLDVSLVISPLMDASGRVLGASKVARDITERKRAEAILARDKETLERLVAERTLELERSNERLRVADRMATIGTLSAGLGHDMGNLLLPVRMRLDTMEQSDIPHSVRADIEAIRTATRYMQRLAGSLRLLALDPDEAPSDFALTDLSEWWSEVEVMMRNCVPRASALVAQMPERLPRPKLGKAALTQLVFNLVQNAGLALRGRADGRIVVSAEPGGSGREVRIRVTDNGPGMSEEIRQRCREPFFTTRTRGLGTGLGLALVSGIVSRAGGSMEIHSTPGTGTTIEILLPAAPSHDAGAASQNDARGVAVVALKDSRLRAHVNSVLASLAYDIRLGGSSEEADVWITDTAANGLLEAARCSAQSQSTRRIILISEESRDGAAGIIHLDPSLKPSLLRARLQEILEEPRPAEPNPAAIGAL